jgi:hypothetical protein
MTAFPREGIAALPHGRVRAALAAGAEVIFTEVQLENRLQKI